MAYYYPEPKFVTEYTAHGSAGEYDSLDHFSDSVYDWLLKNGDDTCLWMGSSSETRGQVTTYSAYVRIFDQQMATLFLLRWA